MLKISRKFYKEQKNCVKENCVNLEEYSLSIEMKIKNFN